MLLKEQEVYSKYQSLGVVRGSNIYLPIIPAIDFVNSCQENLLAVVGIEGLSLVNGKIMPRLDLIADFSSSDDLPWHDIVKSCSQDAINFLSQADVDENTVFDFTVLSKEEW